MLQTTLLSEAQSLSLCSFFLGGGGGVEEGDPPFLLSVVIRDDVIGRRSKYGDYGTLLTTITETSRLTGNLKAKKA